MGCDGCCFEPTVPDRTTDPDAHVVRKYDASGTVLWSRDLAYITPVYFDINAGRVYVRMESIVNTIRTGKIYCLDNATGSVIWSSPELIGRSGNGKFFVLSDGSVVVDMFLGSDYPVPALIPSQMNFIRLAASDGSLVYNVNPYLLAEDRPASGGMICLTATDQIINYGWLDADGVSWGGTNYIFFDAVNGTNGAVFDPLRTVPGAAFVDLTAGDLLLRQFLNQGERNDWSNGNTGTVPGIGGDITLLNGQLTWSGTMVIPLNDDGSRNLTYETNAIGSHAVLSTNQRSHISVSTERSLICGYGGEVDNNCDLIDSSYGYDGDLYNHKVSGPWTRTNRIHFGRLALWNVSTAVDEYDSLYQAVFADFPWPAFPVPDGWAESMSQSAGGTLNRHLLAGAIAPPGTIISDDEYWASEWNVGEEGIFVPFVGTISGISGVSFSGAFAYDAGGDPYRKTRSVLPDAQAALVPSDFDITPCGGGMSMIMESDRGKAITAPSFSAIEWLNTDVWNDYGEFTRCPMAEQSVITSDGYAWQPFNYVVDQSYYSADLPTSTELAGSAWSFGASHPESIFYADFSATSLNISGLALHSTRANRGLISKSLLAMRGTDSKLYFVSQSGINGSVSEVTLEGGIIPANGSTPDGLTYTFTAETWQFPYAVLPGSKIVGVFGDEGFHYIGSVNSSGSFLWASNWGWGTYNAPNAIPIAGQFNSDGTLVVFGERAYDEAPPAWIQTR